MSLKITQRETGSVWSSDRDTPLVYNNLNPEVMNPNKGATATPSESGVTSKAKEVLSYLQNTDNSKVYQSMVYNAEKSEDGTFAGKTAAEWRAKLEEAQANREVKLADVTGQFGLGLVDAVNNTKNLPQTVASGSEALNTKAAEKFGTMTSRNYNRMAKLADDSEDGTYNGKTADEWRTSAKEEQSKAITEAKARAEELAEKAQEVGSWSNSMKDYTESEREFLADKGTSAEQFFGDLAYSAGQQLPSMAVGALTGGASAALGASAKAIQTAQSVASLGTMFGNVYNNTYNQLVKTGQYDITDIAKKAGLDALVEVGTEILVGGTPGLGRGLLDTTEEKVLSKVSAGLVAKLDGKIANSVGLSCIAAKATKFLVSDGAKFLYDVFGEGVEEVASEFLGQFVDRATIDPNAESPTSTDYWLAFAGGAITSAFFNMANLAFTKAQSDNKVVVFDENDNATVKPANEITEEDLEVKPGDEEYLNPTKATTETTDTVETVDTAETVSTTNTSAEASKATTKAGNTTLNINDSTVAYKLNVRNAVKLINKSIFEGLTTEERQSLSETGIDETTIRGQLYRGFIPSKALIYSADMTLEDVSNYVKEVLEPQYAAYVEGVQLRKQIYGTDEAYRSAWFEPAVNIKTDAGANRAYTYSEYLHEYLNGNNISENASKSVLKRASKDARAQFDKMIQQQKAEADSFIGEFKGEVGKLGIGMRLATDAEITDMLDDAEYDINTNEIIVNPYSCSNELLARVAIAHEFVHAAEYYGRNGEYGLDNFKFSTAEKEVGKGMRLLESALDKALAGFGIDAKTWRAKYHDMYSKDFDTKWANQKAKLSEAEYNEFKDFSIRSEEDAAILSNLLATSDTMFTTAVNANELAKGLRGFVKNLIFQTPESVAKTEFQKVEERIEEAIDEAEVFIIEPDSEYDKTTNEELIGFDDTPDEDYIGLIFSAKNAPAKTESKAKTTKKTTKKKADEAPAFEIVDEVVSEVIAPKGETVEVERKKRGTPFKDTVRDEAAQAIAQAEYEGKQAAKDYQLNSKLKNAKLKALKEYPIGKNTNTKATMVYSTLADSNGEIWIRPNGRTSDAQRAYMRSQGFTPYRYGKSTVWRRAFDQAIWDRFATGSEKGMDPEQLTLANDANDPIYNKENPAVGGKDNAVDILIADRADELGDAYETVKTKDFKFLAEQSDQERHNLNNFNPEGFVNKEVTTSELTDAERERLFGTSVRTTSTAKVAPSKAVLKEFKKTAPARLSMLMQYPELNDPNISDEVLTEIYNDVYRPKVNTVDNMYSKIEGAIQKMSDHAWSSAKGDANSLTRYLRKSANGVSAEEIKYSGIIPYLEANPNATKQDAIEYLQLNPYSLEEIKIPDPTYGMYATTFGDNYNEYVYTTTKHLDDSGNLLFNQYRGQDYYGGPHFGEYSNKGDIVLHVRTSDYDYKGDKLLFVEETQSDLHSAGRKKGYDTLERRKEQDRLLKNVEEAAKRSREYRESLSFTPDEGWTFEAIKKLNALYAEEARANAAYDGGSMGLSELARAKQNDIEIELIDKHADLIKKVVADGRATNNWSAIQGILSPSSFNRVNLTDDELSAVSELREKYRLARDEEERWFPQGPDEWEEERAARDEVPPEQPYKETYQDYAMKRMIDKAVREGYDRVAWTSADMQVDRYGYEKGRKGYTDLYNRKIPNFLNKYLAQWGIKIEDTHLNTGTKPRSYEGPDYSTQLRSEFNEYGSGIYDEYGNYLGENLDSITDSEIADNVDAIARTRHKASDTGLVTYQVNDFVIAELNNATDMRNFAISFAADWLRNGEPVLGYNVQSFKINDAMRKDILENGQSRFDKMIETPSFEFTPEDDAQWKDLVDKYGTIKKTSYKTDADGNVTKTVTDTGIPKQVSEGAKVSQTAATILDGLNDQLDEAARKNILRDGMSYIPTTDKRLEGQARSWLNGSKFKAQDGTVDISKALDNWVNRVEANGGAVTPQELMQGMVLWAEIKSYAQNNTLNDTQLRQWDKLMTNLAICGSQFGLGLQLFRNMKRLDGTGREYYMNRSVESLRDEINQVRNYFGQKVKNSLDDIETTDEYKAYMDAIKGATTEAELTKAEEDMKNYIASRIPPTISSRVRAWRYLSMLGNIRTHERNIISNAAMFITKNLRDMQDGVIEDIFIKDGTASRNTSASNRPSAEIRQLADEQWNVHKANVQAGGKLGFNADIMQRTKSYGNSVVGKALEKVSRWNSDLLEAEDAWFLRATFKQSFSQYVAANAKSWMSENSEYRSVADYLKSDNANAIENLNKAIAHATKEAQRATYREASNLASWLNTQEKKGTIQELIIEGIVPFKRTPINILKQGARYSPFGIVNAIKKLTLGVHNGDITANGVNKNTGLATETIADAIGDLCAGMTGTMIMGLGLFLGGTGAMKAGGDDDKEEYYDEMLGNQEYSLTIGDTNITLDWLTPISMPLFAGVTLANALAEESDDDADVDNLATFNNILRALSTMADPFTNLSLLSGINDALNSYSDDKLGEAVTSAIGNYASQFLPTVGGQIARTIDPTRRTTYAEKDVSFIGGQTGAKFWNKVKNKIPGLASTNEAYIDQWGRTEERSGNILERAVEQMALPWYAKKINTTEADDLIAEVFAESKDNSVIPATPQSYYTINEEKYYLDPEDYTTVKKTVGQLSYAGVTDLSNSTLFDKLTADQKADVISNIYTYAKAVAKSDYADENNIELTSTNSDIAKVDAASQVGIGLGEYYIIKMLISDKVAGTKKAQKREAARALGLNTSQMEVFGL